MAEAAERKSTGVRTVAELKDGAKRHFRLRFYFEASLNSNKVGNRTLCVTSVHQQMAAAGLVPFTCRTPVGLTNKTVAKESHFCSLETSSISTQVPASIEVQVRPHTDIWTGSKGIKVDSHTGQMQSLKAWNKEEGTSDGSQRTATV